MLTSLKRWVQDVAVDLVPPPQPPSSASASQLSPSSASYSSSSLTSKREPTNPYHYATTSSYEQSRYNAHLSTNLSSSTMALSRPTSMDSVRSSKVANTSIPPPQASPAELDLSHLNREEQEHIANVLRRARAVDEQQSPVPPVIVHPIQMPPASIVPTSLSPSVSSSSSTSTSSFHSEIPEEYDQNDKNDNIDDNEICQDEELPSPSPESTLITIHRCQVCNKEHQQQKGNTAICLQCQADEEVARVTQNNVNFISLTKNPSSPLPIEFNEEKIYDNIMKIDQEPIKQNSPSENYTSYINHQYTEQINDNQGQEQLSQPVIFEPSPPPPPPPTLSSSLSSSLSTKTRTNNLTEIDENDFFYQEPSPYTTAVIETNQIPDKFEEPIIPSYKIDEYIDDDDSDERDHVKELEETIANLSRHFPVSSQQVNDNEIKPIVTTEHQPLSLSVNKIDVDSILEMEIESPSADDHYISSLRPSSTSPQHPLNVSISVPISFNNRRISLSRSSGVRENLTDFLTPTITTTTTPATKSYYSDNRPLQRTESTSGKRLTSIQRQKRNLPSVPSMLSHLRLRRANSESRFSLPAVPSSNPICNSNIDDESDLLEIDLNNPTNRASRSKTEFELSNNNDMISYLKTLNTTTQLLSMDDISLPQKQVKQLRDQTTNTPPMANFTSSMKTKKKLKKKGSSSPSNTNGHHSSSTQINGQTTPVMTSPTRPNPPSILLSSSSLPIPQMTQRPKVPKSTSTEMLYSFPVSKLLLSRDNLSPSRRIGADLGLRITGGHSIPNCMEVAACIEHIDSHHKNYNILKNAVQEGDEVLEVGGVSLRGKSTLFVQNLIDSIQDEFEIVVRSKHTLPPISPPIQIHKPEKTTSNIQSRNNLTVDSNVPRRHSMDTSQASPTHSTNNTTVMKSQSTIMSLPVNQPSNVSEQLLSPIPIRKKSVSSKECLFPVESLHRVSSSKSFEHLIKVATQPAETSLIDDELYNITKQERKPSIKQPEQPSVTSVKQTSLNKSLHEHPTNVSQPSRMYDQRNSLNPNDSNLHVSRSNQRVNRQNSNDSDESDNLAQYFPVSTNQKSSIMPASDISKKHLSDESNRNVISTDNESTLNASRRLQSFLKTSEENRQSKDSMDDETFNFKNPDEIQSSAGLSSFSPITKKKDSIDLINQPIEIRENDYVGDIEIQIGHNSEHEQLVIRIVQAKNLPAKDTNGYSDPFVKIYLLPGRDQENKRRTKHISKNLNPVWDHTVIYGNMHREELQYKMLEFTVWDYDRFKANDFIGQITIDLKDAKVIDDKPHWYRLQALRSREEATNRGSSPRLFKMTSVDSTASSSVILTKNNVNIPARVNQRK